MASAVIAGETGRMAASDGNRSMTTESQLELLPERPDGYCADMRGCTRAMCGCRWEQTGQAWNNKIAALFVQEDGCYKGLLGVDAYDAHRNALTYTGNYPVVAHPPCQLWGKMANVNFARWGGDHNMPGNDGGCFKFALDAVNRCGGVLEHPAQSYAWARYGLIKPVGDGWQKSGGGWVCEVWQSAYGHRANKATWLYYSGKFRPFDLNWNRPKGTHQVGFQDKRGKAKNKPTLNKAEANSTPVLFRDELIKLVLWSQIGSAD